MITQALAETMAAVRLIVPLDVVELVKAIFMGLGALGGVFATIYLPWLAARQKRTESATIEVAKTVAAVSAEVGTVSHQINGLLAARDQAKVREGKAEEKVVSDRVAAATAEGQKQGVEAALAGAPLPVTKVP